MELRPLGFGEIFDRAVTLYIRNFIPFAAIVAVMIVPLAILQYLLDVSSQPQFDAVVRILTHPHSFPTAPVPSTFSSPGMVAVFVAMLLLTYAVWPFALNAVAVGVARLYRGRPVEFRVCYEIVLRHWLRIIAMIGFDVLIFIGWYLAVIAVIVLLVFAIGAFGAVIPGLGFWFGFAFGFLGVIALLPSLGPLVVAMTFAMYAVVIEERPVAESLYVGFARVFNRAEFWRAVLFSLAVGAVMLGGSAMFGFIALVAGFFHLPLLQATIESLARAVITPFAVVLLAVYYFDVRIRREAFDLETSLDRLAAAQPA